MAYRQEKRSRFWLKTLVVGFFIFLTSMVALLSTGNPNLFPTIVLVGNFIVPISFVSFFYERRSRYDVSMLSTALGFVFGGVLGTAAAAILEPYFIHTITFGTAFIVGVIEESTKLIGVLLIVKRNNHTSMMNGIILGAAAGMGFAAFESTGYAFTHFLQSGGSLSAVVFITLIRGIVAPVGHGTWTAILSSVIFRESGSNGYNINQKVVGAFITVVLLHGFWDGIPIVIENFSPSIIAVLVGQSIVGVIGIIIIYKQWHEARKEVYIENKL